MELTRAVGAVLHRIYLLVVSALLVGGAVYFWSGRQPITFQATALLAVAAPAGSGQNLGLVSSSTQAAQRYAALPLPAAALARIGAAMPQRTPDQIASALHLTSSGTQPTITVTADDRAASVAVLLANNAALAVADQYNQQSLVDQAQITKQVDALQVQVKALDASIATTQAAIDADSNAGKDTSTLKATLAGLQQQKIQDTQQIQTLNRTFRQRVFLLSVAQTTAAATRIGPNRQLDALVGAGAGLLAGAGLALLLDLLDGIVRVAVDTSRFAGLTTLAVVGDVAIDEGGLGPLDPDNYFAVADTYRTLARSLAFLNATRDLQIVLATPADNAPNADLVGVNLAITFALAGEPTLLVDANWNAPSVEARFGMRPSEQGVFTSLLAIASQPPLSLQTALATEIPGLALLPVGILPPNLDELVQSPLLHQLLTALRSQYAHIVLLAPTDMFSQPARQLADQLDGTLVVVRADYSAGAELATFTRALRQANFYLVGAALVQSAPLKSRAAPSAASAQTATGRRPLSSNLAGPAVAAAAADASRGPPPGQTWPADANGYPNKLSPLRPPVPTDEAPGAHSAAANAFGAGPGPVAVPDARQGLSRRRGRRSIH